MALTKVSSGLINTSIVDNGNATAITIDSSENVAFSGEITANGGIDVTGDVNTSGLIKVGVNDTEYANNYIRFKPTGASYIDHSVVGQSINFRLSNASSLDKTPLVISPTGIDVTGTATMNGLTVDHGLIKALHAGGLTAFADFEQFAGWDRRLRVTSAAAGIGIDVTNIALSSGRNLILQETGGNVGIGTVSPSELLEVNSTGATAAIEISAGTAAATTGEAKIVLRSLYSASGTTYSRSEIASLGVAGGDSDLIFRTTTDSSGPQERMRITSAGAMQIAGNGTDNDSYPITFKNGAAAIARDDNDLKLHGYSNIVFGVSNTSYPTSTERMRIDGAGIVTMPYQPAFDVYHPTGSYASGTTPTSLDLSSVRLNRGGHYSTSNHRFIAPVAGVYQFNYTVIINGAYSNLHIRMLKNGAILQGSDTHASPQVAGLWTQVCTQIVVQLAVNDYVQVLHVGNANIYGNSYQSFNGCLLG